MTEFPSLRLMSSKPSNWGREQISWRLSQKSMTMQSAFPGCRRVPLPMHWVYKVLDLGRPAHQDAADARLIEPFGEEVAVGEDLDIASREGS